MNGNFETLYEQIGGGATIQKLVDAFYPKVFSNEELLPIFNGNMEDIKRKQFMFLSQFLGGPALYSEEFGPPAMRQRHLPFEITPVRAENWLSCMEEAFEEIGLSQTPEGQLFFHRLKQVAAIMVNSNE
jgi:hemoglobin